MAARHPAVEGVWRALSDEPVLARALAVRLDPAAPGRVPSTAARRAAALGVLRAWLLAEGAGGAVDLAGCLRALCEAERLAAPASAGVALHADLRPVRARVGTAARIGLAFCELLRNALDHAFAPGGMGHVGVHLWSPCGLPGVRACLLVADDGRGFGAEPPAAAGRGIALARRLVGRCGGALTRDSGGTGTVWCATLPRAGTGGRPRGATPGASPGVPPAAGERRPEVSRPGGRRGAPGGP